MKYISYSFLLLVALALVLGLVFSRSENLDLVSGTKTLALGFIKRDLRPVGKRLEDQPSVIRNRVSWQGSIENLSLDEASGLARSQVSDSLIFAINDSGNKPQVFGLNLDGQHLGSWHVDYKKHHDFEDLSSFTYKGENYLLIADTGDNLNWRNSLSLLWVMEPKLESLDKKLTVQKTHTFSFVGGYRDIESVAVDENSMVAYLVSKKRIPPEVFKVDLRETSHQLLESVGLVHGIPAPTARDLFQSERFGMYSSSPTSMDMVSDKAVILTYKEIYLFDKKVGQTWVSALSQLPKKIPLPQLYGLEAITFAQAPGKVLITGERENGVQSSEIFEISF